MNRREALANVLTSPLLPAAIKQVAEIKDSAKTRALIFVLREGIELSHKEEREMLERVGVGDVEIGIAFGVDVRVVS